MLCPVSATTLEDYEDGYAEVIGVSKYQDPDITPTLEGVISDLEHMDDALYNKQYGIFYEDEVTDIFDEQATKSEILQFLGSASHMVDSKGLFIFYFSGHGTAVTGISSICPYDTSDDENSLVSATEIKANLEEIDSKNIICIFDCCQSGGFIDTLTAGNPDKSKYVILTAARKDEYASDEGSFTTYFYDAITVNAPKADTDKDGWVSVEEAFKYASKGCTTASQHPQMFDGNPSDQIELFEY